MLYKYVYGRELVEWEPDCPSEGKKGCLSLFPWKHTCMLLHGIPSAEEKVITWRDCVIQALQPQLDSGKMVLCFRHKRSEMLDPSSFTKWITILAFSVNTSKQLFPLTIFAALTLHVLCLWTENIVMTWVDRVEFWLPDYHVRDCLPPHILWFCHHGFLLCNVHKRNLRFYWAFLKTLLWKIRDLICDELLFCANNIWNNCCC